MCLVFCRRKQGSLRERGDCEVGSLGERTAMGKVRRSSLQVSSAVQHLCVARNSLGVAKGAADRMLKGVSSRSARYQEDRACLCLLVLTARYSRSSEKPIKDSTIMATRARGGIWSSLGKASTTRRKQRSRHLRWARSSAHLLAALSYSFIRRPRSPGANESPGCFFASEARGEPDTENSLLP
jgi:hypothetical protein